ncbi:MAG TPA: MtrB/PioB family decaheme-associated outer membrane protein [Telluria sp.]|nr:MtrB/PioB family decaheme-associated outer membrane protein [Telluria sp.]
MRNTNNNMLVRASVIAVRGALAALFMLPAFDAIAQESEEVRALTQPTSKIEVGMGRVNNASDKFGEYNGLDKSGNYFIGGFDLKGGGSYDSDSTWRWSVVGRDLGLDTRSLDVEFGRQGTFRVNYGYDELQRIYSTKYQTFFDGAGTTTLSLPASFAATPVAQRLSSTANANSALSNWANVQSPYATAACAATGGTPTAACRGLGYLIPNAMHHFDVGTQRSKHNLGGTVVLAPGWEATVSATREDKNGTKLTGVAFGSFRGTLLPEVINSTTDQYRAGVSYTGERGFFNAGYYASFYRNATDTWTAENFFQGNALAPALNNRAKLIGAPDNEAHRISLSGGYNFPHATRATLSANYGRMTQNEDFLTGLPSTWIVPVSSAHAKVVDSRLNATLSNRSVKDLTLSAAYKYEYRDNRTPVYKFTVASVDSPSAPSVFYNDPLNRKMQQGTLEADYAIARRQSLKAGYDYQVVHRSTDNPNEEPWKAETTRESTLRLDYRNNLSQVVTGRVGVSHAQRRHSDYEENAVISAEPALPGFQQFFLAERNRDQLRSSLNIQASDAISVQTGVDYNRDRFKGNQYGAKETRGWVFKLDAAYAASETLSYSGFYTLENRKAQLDSLTFARATATTILDKPAYVPGAACAGYFAASGRLPSDYATDPCRQWTEQQSDKVHTFGFAAKATDLLAGKAELGMDLAYSLARTPITFNGGAYYSNGNSATAATAAVPYNNIWIAGESFPDITSNMLELRMNGSYKLGKQSALRVNYLVRRLRSADWQYDAYANSAQGALAVQAYPGNLMTAPNYTVAVLGVSYVYSFQ